MKTLGAYLYLSDLTKDLQDYLQDNCCYKIGDSPFYVIDNLENIESDEEYDIVSDAFDEFLDSQEFDELVDADDEE